MATRSGEIEVDWADGTHVFRLAIGQLLELEDKTGCGPMELFKRISAGTWRVKELREVVRLALVGGGAKPTDALSLVRRYVDDRPLAESVPLAQACLVAILFGTVEDDRLGEPDRRGSQSGLTGGSPSPTSTERVQ